MKRLLIIIFFFPLLGFAQTSDQYLNSGNQKSNVKNYRGAIADFTSAIGLNGNNVKAYLYRGNAYGNINDYNHAIEDFTKVLAFDPGNTEVYYYRANAFS